MTKSAYCAVAVLTALFFTAGCTTKPVYNVTNAPVATAKGKATADEVRQAIIRAGVALGWQMQEVRPGLIQGTLALRTHLAVVDVSYDANSYSIKYKDSKDLNYDGTSIHNNYNGWIQNLEKGIRAQLSLV
jgi:hypothetical protein